MQESSKSPRGSENFRFAIDDCKSAVRRPVEKIENRKSKTDNCKSKIVYACLSFKTYAQVRHKKPMDASAAFDVDDIRYHLWRIFGDCYAGHR